MMRSGSLPSFKDGYRIYEDVLEPHVAEVSRILGLPLEAGI
jgi:hypothetical protein